MGRAVTIYLGGDSSVTSLGMGTEENFRAIEAYGCGLQPVDVPCVMVAGKIDAAIKQSLLLAGYTPLESLMIRCVADAATQSGVDPASAECVLIISTTKGNVELLCDNLTPPESAYLYTLAERVAAYFGATRPPLVVSNACISGVSAMVVAQRMILDGVCRHAIVVGGDLLTEFVAAGFLSFKSISAVPCRPYDQREDHGLSLGEGCAAILLTADRAKAKSPVVVLEGGAITNDANHISGPSRTGDGLSYAIDRALADAGVAREQVSFVNAHGTGTAYNDAMESRALALSGLSGCPMNSLKGYVGHTLGASGVVESILAAEQMRRGRLFGVAGFAAIGTPEPLNVVAEHRDLQMHHCVKTASGFGGCNAAIVMGLEPYVAPRNDSSVPHNSRVVAHYELAQSEACFADMIRANYKALNAPNMKFFKMDDLCKGGYIASERLLQGVDLGKYDATEVAVVLENHSSSLDTDLAHQRIVNQHQAEGASPAVFVYTLPNVVAGEICIRHHIQGENTFFVTNGDGTTAEHYARKLIARGAAKAVIYGCCDYLAGHYNIQLTFLEQQ